MSVNELSYLLLNYLIFKVPSKRKGRKQLYFVQKYIIKAELQLKEMLALSWVNLPLCEQATPLLFGEAKLFSCASETLFPIIKPSWYDHLCMSKNLRTPARKGDVTRKLVTLHTTIIIVLIKVKSIAHSPGLVPPYLDVLGVAHKLQTHTRLSYRVYWGTDWVVGWLVRGSKPDSWVLTPDPIFCCIRITKESGMQNEERRARRGLCNIWGKKTPKDCAHPRNTLKTPWKRTVAENLQACKILAFLC